MRDVDRQEYDLDCAATPPSGSVLALVLVLGTAVALAAAPLGWPGVAILVALVVLAGVFALRWASWPRPPR